MDTLVMVRNADGTYSFVGNVPWNLAFQQLDGSAPTRKQIHAAQHCGPGFARPPIRTRRWATEASAAAAAEYSGFGVAPRHKAPPRFVVKWRKEDRGCYASSIFAFEDTDGYEGYGFWKAVRRGSRWDLRLVDCKNLAGKSRLSRLEQRTLSDCKRWAQAETDVLHRPSAWDQVNL